LFNRRERGVVREAQRVPKGRETRRIKRFQETEEVASKRGVRERVNPQPTWTNTILVILESPLQTFKKVSTNIMNR
jgi:hypothetical protein